MAPLSGEPAVIKVEPVNDGADVESATNRVELVGTAKYSDAIRDDCALGHRHQKFCLTGESEDFETAPKSAEEDQMGCFDPETD